MGHRPVLTSGVCLYVSGLSRQHATQIMEAARGGKAIFCEKPISLNIEIIDEVLTYLVGSSRIK